MRIVCPYCGERDTREFVFRGEVAVTRPGDDVDEDTVFEQVYLRDNPAGQTDEHWYHAQGCRNWLTVTRDTLTHTIGDARLSRDVAR